MGEETYTIYDLLADVFCVGRENSRAKAKSSQPQSSTTGGRFKELDESTYDRIVATGRL